MPKQTKKHVRIDNNRFEPNNSIEMNLHILSRNMNVEENPGGFQTDQLSDIMTIRRVRSLHRNAKDNVINRLPPRHVAHFATMRRANYIGINEENLQGEGDDIHMEEQQIQQIVNEIEQNNELMEDTPDGEALRLEAVRDIPQCLTVKRNIKAKLSASVSQKSKRRPIGYFKRMKYKWSFWWNKQKENMKNVLFSIELWYYNIKAIEGHFGSGVATYFRFLRWLFLMNVGISMVVISFLVIPQILYANHINISNPVSFSFSDIFTGEGYFTNTSLYYGYYSSDIFSLIEGQYYNLLSAYFFTMVFLYLTVFICLSIKMARSYRTNFIKTSSGLKNVFANKIFCGWDFSIATEEAASLKSMSLYNEVKELLNESYKSTTDLSFGKSCCLLLSRIITHIFVITFLTGIGFLMWYLMNQGLLTNSVGGSSASIILAVIITILVIISPKLFNLIALKFEHYNNPRTQLYITLLRTFVMQAVIVSILCAFWLQSNSSCWETSLAQEVYRLILFDFLISLFCFPLLEYIRKIIYQHVTTKIGMPEFDIAQSTLNLIYNQTLLWLGLFFSPMMAPIVCIKLFILFYIKHFMALKNCQSSTKPWRPAQTQTVFLVLVFFSLLCLSMTLGYIFISVPTGGCGPFKTENYMYLSILSGILNIKKGNVFFNIIMFFTKPGIFALILITMSIFVYYLRAKSKAERSMVNQLRELLVLQSKDKEFLLNAITKVTEGAWIYNQKSKTLLKNEEASGLFEDSPLRKPSNANFQLSPRIQTANYSFGNLSSSFRFQPSSSGYSSNESYSTPTEERRNYENVSFDQQ